MTAETNIIIEQHENALLLPTSAVTKNKIWRVDAGRLVEQSVAVGATGPDWVELLRGIGPEDLIVLKPDSAVSVGTRVEAKLVESAKR